MTSLSKDDRRAAAARCAAEWQQRLDAEDLTAGDRGEFVDWLRESPVHVAEMMRAKLVHRGLSDYPSWAELAAPHEGINPQSSPVAWLHGENIDAPSGAPRSLPKRFPPRRALLAAAACILMLTVVGLAVAPRFTSTRISTQAGERREITLADGSTITLSSNTALRFRLTSTLRSIRLDRGNALFHVAKDPQRPFVVDAAQADIRAVGTVFNVSVNSESVVVTVTEGRVAVNPIASQSAMESITVGANQQVAVSPGGRATPVHQMLNVTEHGLGEPQLSFDSQTVAEIVQRFNALNRVKIRITDEALARRRVTGIFNAMDPQSFVAFLEAAAGVVATRRDANEVEVGSMAGHSPQHLD